MFFHHQTIRKYTAALLDLFNNLETQDIMSNNEVITHKVPIVFSSREKADIFNSSNLDTIFSSNTNILPRGSLVFESLTPAFNRSKTKQTKILKKTKHKTLDYTFTSVPYDFSYKIIYQTRGMNEAMQIVEQVASYFNPSYCLKINELELQQEPTSIILELEQTDIDQQDYEQYSTNIVTITFSLVLRGNIYPPIREQSKVEFLNIYMNELINDKEYIRKSLLESNIVNTKPINSTKTAFEYQVIPNLITIIYKNNKLEPIFIDKDNKIELNEFEYKWLIDNNTTENTRVLDISNLEPGVHNISLQIVDYHGNTSNIINKQIIKS